MQQRPNILIFITDQHRFDALGCNGNPVIKTPNIDKLAATGINFQNAYVCQPICLPQRNSMLTGLYPSAHKSIVNGIGLDKSLPVYPELLRQSGYQTYAAGKMHLSPIARGFDNPPYEPGEIPDAYPYYGFEKIDFVEGENSPYLQMLNNNGFELKNPNDCLQYDPDGPFQVISGTIPEPLHRSTWTAERTIDFLAKRDPDKPFLAHCSFWDPHHPFDPSEPFDTMYNSADIPLPVDYNSLMQELPAHFKRYAEEDRKTSGKSFANHTPQDWQRMIAHYYGTISLIDKNVGKVIKALKDHNLYENTAIFFVADHGELLGDHGLALKGPFMYQPLIKVPFIFSYPAMQSDADFNGMVMTYDLMPTILELANLVPPEQITAQSLLSQINGIVKPRNLVMIENFSEGLSAKTIITDQFKLTCYLETDEGDLFDLKNDPQELVNLWETELGVKAKLLQQLNQLQIKTVKPSPKPISKW